MPFGTTQSQLFDQLLKWTYAEAFAAQIVFESELSHILTRR